MAAPVPPVRVTPRLLAAALVAAMAATGCARAGHGEAGGSPTAGPTAFPLTLTDDEGVRVTLPAVPRRIVTFAPANTEIVFALGLRSRLVGVSYHAYDSYPPAAKTIPEVGGANVSPSIEKVVSLHPDLLLATGGGEQWKRQLRGLGVPVFTIGATSFDDALHDMRTVGRLTGTTAAADRLTSQMAKGARSIQQKVAAQAPVSCFLDIGGLYTVGPKDFPYDLLKRAGCEPVTSGASAPYPQWSKDELVKENPSVFLYTSDSGDSRQGVENDPALRSIAAVRDGRVEPVDSDLISRPGPRLVEGLTALARALHPSLFP